jgi:hypothetical protein
MTEIIETTAGPVTLRTTRREDGKRLRRHGVERAASVVDGVEQDEVPMDRRMGGA